MRNAAAKIKTDFEEAIRILNEENKACQSSFENFAKNVGEKFLCLAALSEGKELERCDDFGGTVLNRQVPGIVRMAQLPSPIRNRYSRHLVNSLSVTRNIRLTDF